MLVVEYVFVEKVLENAKSAARAVGIPLDTVSYAGHLVTNRTLLGSIAVLAGSSVLFSPFFPLFWLSLAGSIVGIAMAIHQVDAVVEAEKRAASSDSGHEAASVSPRGDNSTEFSLMNMLAFLFQQPD
ncbi:MAG: hypothetical protein LBI34_00815 [Puniceicoccales bacterium]|nr:hypothetical protein [Puniceicoccales bacterium]